ncbi:MAG: hypothetical protein J07HX64_03001 [halophilic archaeon J07HX64]|jgi:hypothetical protein|nr:MAG: hypothetical protein J07HX64_03001 [halophilic archaeon J07HX64]
MTDDEGEHREDGIISTEELDVVDSEAVQELDEHRHVIGVDDDDNDTVTETNQTATQGQSDPLPAGAYSVRVRGRSRDETDLYSVGTNNVATTFEQLIVWYARFVAPDEPPEETIGTLLSHSDITPFDDSSG